MLEVSVLDSTAQARTHLVEWLRELLERHASELQFAPAFSVRPVGVEELQFRAQPNVCLVGESLIHSHLLGLADIRRRLPDCYIVVALSGERPEFHYVEQLARLGADDVLSPGIDDEGFLRRLVVRSRRQKAHHAGTLTLFVGAKGGVGTTSLCAGVGEAMLDLGKRVAVVDLDDEHACLSRYLKIRPPCNENLDRYLHAERLLDSDAIEQCSVRVWSDTNGFICIPPSLDSEALYHGDSTAVRAYLHFLELFDHSFDYVFVDAARARGTLLTALVRAANQVVFVTDDDAASVIAGVESLRRLRVHLSPSARMVCAISRASRFGVGATVIAREFSEVLPSASVGVETISIPYSRSVRNWVASGMTPYSIGDREVERGCAHLAAHLSGELLPARSFAQRGVSRQKLLGRLWRKATAVQGAVPPLAVPEEKRALPDISASISAPPTIDQAISGLSFS